MEWKKMIIVALAVVVLMVIGVLFNPKADNIKFKEEYERLNGKKSESGTYLKVKIDKDNPMIYANIEDVQKLLENGTGVIYFGFPECPWCRNMVPNLIESAKENEIDKIYYYNAYDDRDILILDENNNIVTRKEKSKNYEIILELLQEHLEDYVLTNGEEEVSTGEKRLYFPTVVFVKDGNITLVHVSTVESQTDPSVPLTKDQSLELKNIFKEGFSSLSDTCQKDRC